MTKRKSTDLTGRVAVVTGAGAGLGRAHALLLARHGARVVVNDLGESAERVADEIAAAGGEALAVRGSVTDEDQVAALVEAATGRWGGIHILVSNAGILRDASFAKMSMADFRQVMDVHLYGAVICCKAVWAGMKAQHHGRIVLTTSSSGLFGNFGQANYGAAKMALVGLMQTLGIEGAKNDIRVNCLAPTAATAMTDALLPDAVKAMLVPERVSPGLLKLVSDDAPTRAILTAGAGHFGRAYVTLTQGAFVGSSEDMGEGVFDAWDAISDRTAEIVPDAGGAQVQREITSPQTAVSKSVIANHQAKETKSVTNIDGSYDLSARTPMGEQSIRLTVKAEGTEFSGTTSGAFGSSDVSGIVQGTTISWQQSVTVPMPLTLECTLTIDGNAASGSADTGAFGIFPLTGQRSA